LEGRALCHAQSTPNPAWWAASTDIAKVGLEIPVFVSIKRRISANLVFDRARITTDRSTRQSAGMCTRFTCTLGVEVMTMFSNCSGPFAKGLDLL
jgi:hypothetical protein